MCLKVTARLGKIDKPLEAYKILVKRKDRLYLTSPYYQQSARTGEQPEVEIFDKDDLRLDKRCYGYHLIATLDDAKEVAKNMAFTYWGGLVDYVAVVKAVVPSGAKCDAGWHFVGDGWRVRAYACNKVSYGETVAMYRPGDVWREKV